MLNAVQRKGVLELSQSLPFIRKLGDTGTEVEVKINSISWYTAKAIYVGQVTGPFESGYVGRKVVGALRPWFEQNRAAIESHLGKLTEKDIEYLMVAWNTDEPQTAHELTAARRLGYN